MSVTKQYIFKVIHSLQLIWWFVRRPTTRGAKCLIEHDGRFLLVQLSYAHRSWTIPGGGVKRRETPEEGVRREVLEEVNIVLDDVVFIGAYPSTRYFKKDTVYCFYSKRSNGDFTIDDEEIRDAGWFRREELPEGYVPSVEYMFEMYDKFRS